MNERFAALLGRVGGTLLVVVIIAIGLLVGALGASVFAGFDLGPDADSEAVKAWVNARPFIPTTIGWLVAMPLLVLLGRQLFRIPMDAMGLRPAPTRRPRFVLGVLGGLALILVPALLARALGGYAPMAEQDIAALSVPSGSLAIGGIVYLLPALMIAALGEELLFRGLLLRFWEPVAGVKGALLLTALLFVVVHVGNPGSSPLGAIGVLLAGIWLGLVFVLHGDLWLAAGLHLGWNVSEAMVLGVPVSGHTLPALLRWEVSEGSTWQGLLGGSFGPEEGLLFHMALVVAIVITVLTRPLQNPGLNDPGGPSVRSVDDAPAGS